MVRVFHCDDAAALRLLVREVLSDHGIEVVGEAATVAEAEARLPGVEADVVLIDLLEGLTEDELVGRLAPRAPDARFVVYSGRPERDGATAAAHLHKAAELAELRRVILEVATGR